jgi:hypothetical protein
MLPLLGAALTGMGLLAYTGLWRSWSRGGHHFYVLGLFWYGLAMLIASTLSWFAPHRTGSVVRWSPSCSSVCSAPSTCRRS